MALNKDNKNNNKNKNTYQRVATLLILMSVAIVDIVPLMGYAVDIKSNKGEVSEEQVVEIEDGQDIGIDEQGLEEIDLEIEEDEREVEIEDEHEIGEELFQEDYGEGETEEDVTQENEIIEEGSTEIEGEGVQETQPQTFMAKTVQSTPTYVLAKDSDFTGSNGSFRYIGTDENVEVPHTIKGQTVTSYYQMFRETKVKGVKSTNTKVTDMTGMFIKVKSETLDVSQLNTVNVDKMPAMFQDSEMHTITGLENFRTSHVKLMRTMFSGSKVKNLDLRSFDTSKVYDFGQMFMDSEVENLDVSTFNTQGAANMGNMFYNSKVKKLDLSSFDTSKVSSMGGMFYNTDATEIDVSSFNTAIVQDMYGMFSRSNANTIDVSNFDTSKVKNMGEMFSHSNATTIKGLTNFRTESLSNMVSMFQESKVKDIDLSSFDTGRITDMTNLFRGSEAERINVSNFDTKIVIDMTNMFKDTKVSSLDLSSFDMGGVNSTYAMFEGTTATSGVSKSREDRDILNKSVGKPQTLDFTSKYKLATDEDFSGTLNGYFKYTGKEEYVEVPHTIKGVTVNSYKGMFTNTSVKGVASTNKQVTDMSEMFKGNTSNKLDVTLLDTTNVTNMRGMFQDTKATILDVRNIRTGKAEDVSDMFRNTSAEALDLSEFNLSNANNLNNMVYQTKSKVGYARTKDDANKINNSSNKPEGLTFTVRGVITTQTPDRWTNGAVNIGVEADFGDVGVQYIELLNGGGRNYFRKDTEFTGLVGLVRAYHDHANNGFYMVSNAEGNTMRIDKVIHGNGHYTFSADIMSTEDVLLHLDITDNRTDGIYLKAGEWNRLERTHDVTNWSAGVYRFIDVNELPKGTVYFRDVKIEEGRVATPWIPAIEDSDTAGDSNTFPVYNNGTYLFRATDDNGNNKTVSHTVTTIDRENPTIEITPSTTGQTSQDVTLYVKAKDNLSGVKEIILPDGKRVNGNEAEFIAKDNKEYTFKAVDNAGNTETITHKVNNIDRSLVEVTTEVDNSNWTRDPVNIKVTSEESASKLLNIEMTNSPKEGRNLHKETSSSWVNVNMPAYLYYHRIGTDILLEEGKDYTYSIDVEKVSNDSVDIKSELGQGSIDRPYRIDISHDKGGGYKSIPLNGTRYTRVFSKRIDTPYEYFAWGLRNDLKQTTIRYKEVKVEEGSKPTPWTPAPEDIKLVNNSKTYPVVGNGLYTFKATYENGATSEVSVNISNIDLDAPTIEVLNNPEDWSDEDEIELEIKVSDNNQSGVKSITLPNGETTTQTDIRYTVTENGSYEFIVEDNVGNITTHTEEVEHLMIPYKFYVYDNEGKPVKGSVFELMRDGEAYKTATSDDKGLVDFGKIPPVGQYTIRQISSGDGGAIIPGDIEVEDPTDPIEIINYPRGTEMPSTGTMDYITYGVIIVVLLGLITIYNRKRNE